MMRPFIVLAALTLRGAMACIPRTQNRALKFVAVGWIALTAIHLGIYVRYGLKQPFVGSIALRQPHAVRFVADNGVAAYLPATLRREYQQLYQVVHRYAAPDDYTVCHPCGPMVILIDDVAMNETPFSRFSVWAAATLACVRQTYRAQRSVRA